MRDYNRNPSWAQRRLEHYSAIWIFLGGAASLDRPRAAVLSFGREASRSVCVPVCGVPSDACNAKSARRRRTLRTPGSLGWPSPASPKPEILQ